MRLQHQILLLIWCLFVVGGGGFGGHFVGPNLVQSFKMFQTRANTLDNSATMSRLIASDASSSSSNQNDNEKDRAELTGGSTGMDDIYYETSYHDHFGDLPSGSSSIGKLDSLDSQKLIDIKLDKIIRLVDYKSDLEILRVDKLDVSAQRSFRALDARLDKLESKLDAFIAEQSKLKSAPSGAKQHQHHQDFHEDEEQDSESVLLNRMNKVYNIHQETYRICKEALLTGSSRNFHNNRGRKASTGSSSSSNRFDKNIESDHSEIDIVQHRVPTNSSSALGDDLDPELSTEIDQIVTVLSLVINQTLGQHLEQVRKIVSEELNIIEFYAMEKYKNEQKIIEKVVNLKLELLESNGQLSAALIDIRDGQTQDRDLLNRIDDEIVAIMTSNRGRSNQQQITPYGSDHQNQTQRTTTTIDEQTLRTIMDEYIEKILLQLKNQSLVTNNNNHYQQEPAIREPTKLLITKMASSLGRNQNPITNTTTTTSAPITTSAPTVRPTAVAAAAAAGANQKNSKSVRPSFHRLIYTNPWIRFLDFGQKQKFVTHTEPPPTSIRQHRDGTKSTWWSTLSSSSSSSSSSSADTHQEEDLGLAIGQSTTTEIKPPTIVSVSPLINQRPEQRNCTKQSDAYFPSSCYKVWKGGATCSDVYTILTETKLKRKVFCDMEHNGGGWTVILRRGKSTTSARAMKSVKFDTNLSHYRRGFGILQGELFLGLDLIHLLTTASRATDDDQTNKSQSSTLLQVDLEDALGNYRSFVYGGFRIGSASDDHRFYVDKVIATSKSRSLKERSTENEFRLASALLQLNGTEFLSHSEPRHSQVQRCRTMFQSDWWYRSHKQRQHHQEVEENQDQNYCQTMAPVQLMAPLSSSLSNLALYWQGWTESELRFVTLKVKPQFN